MPKTVKNLWPDVVSWDNLLAAWHEARKGKRYKPDVLRFHQNWEERLVDLQNRLIWGSWSPSPFSAFYVHEPKKRLIEAPRFEDRVVHHALHRVIEPYFERRFLDDSFACRKGRGTHAACARLQQQLRAGQRKWGRVHVLQIDMSRYFASIRHDELKLQIRRTVGDPQVLRVWDQIIDNTGDRGVGIPIGALTSQLGANLYLDAFDHHVKNAMGMPFLNRYMDDAVILGPSAKGLKETLHYLRAWLLETLGLSLSKGEVFPASRGVDFAGYRTWATHILPRKRNITRARRRIKSMARRYWAGELQMEAVRPSVSSLIGYTKHCSSRRTVEGLTQDWMRNAA